MKKSSLKIYDFHDDSGNLIIKIACTNVLVVDDLNKDKFLIFTGNDYNEKRYLLNVKNSKFIEVPYTYVIFKNAGKIGLAIYNNEVSLIDNNFNVLYQNIDYNKYEFIDANDFCLNSFLSIINDYFLLMNLNTGMQVVIDLRYGKEKNDFKFTSEEIYEKTR